VRVINAMSVDVEDYFHVSVFDGVVPRSRWDTLESRVCANTERLLEIFSDAGVLSTFFVLGWVGRRHPTLVKRIADAGHEIASHGYAHRLVYDLPPERFREDVRRAKAVLEDVAQVPVAGYRAPSYSVTPRSLWALDILIEEGYTYDASIFPIHHDRYGIPVSDRHAYVIERHHGSLVETPASTIRWGPMNLPIAGGGYFRILPYAWTKWGIDRLNRLEERPAIFYLHPWEIDPNQPRLHTSRLSRFRHYRNLDKTEERLRALLRDFSFSTLASVIPQLVPVERLRNLDRSLPYVW
jgi:polysaccharide deacetylase family protein (PEP-CTERM system associated)